jgi:hypothetical protein
MLVSPTCYDRYQEEGEIVISQHRHGRLHNLLKRIRAFLKREPPGDPYAFVTAPKKPRPPHRSTSVAELPEQ